MGLGDLLERLIVWVFWLFGRRPKPCAGCARRKAALNSWGKNLVASRPAEPPNEQVTVIRGRDGRLQRFREKLPPPNARCR